MVKAILEGRKTVTRRLVKPTSKYDCGIYVHNNETVYNREPERTMGTKQNPPYKPGDILYVRETWHQYEKRVGKGESCHMATFYGYKASIANSEDAHEPWKPSIHMPKEAARIFLKVKDVRVERLQEITEEQATKEGCHAGFHEYIGAVWGDEDTDEWTAIEAFMDLWNSTIKKSDIDIYGWDANPWVWVIESERVEVLN